MDAYRISDADGTLNDLIGRVEAGESVDIERDGRVVARLVPSTDPVQTPPRFDWENYFEQVRKLPFDPTNSVAEMRKQARY